MNNTAIRILRWLLCIPVGIASGFAAYFLLSLFNGNSFIQYLIAGGAGGAATVWIACRIAPSHQKILAVSLSVLSVLLTLLVVSIIIQNEDWKYLSYCIAQDIGIIYCTVSVWKGNITFK